MDDMCRDISCLSIHVFVKIIHLDSASGMYEL